MTEEPDPLEVELSALRPRSISTDLRRRIEAQMVPPALRRPRTVWKWRIASCLVAACLATVLLRWNQPDGVVAPPGSVGPAVTIAAAPDDSEPTLLAYQRAVSRSSEDLHILLNRHPRMTSVSNPALVRVSDFTRFDTTLDLLLGEN